MSAFNIGEYKDLIDDAANGTFTLFSQRVEFDDVKQIDWHHQIESESDFHLWRMKLAHMDFICPMLTKGDDRHI